MHSHLNFECTVRKPLIINGVSFNLIAHLHPSNNTAISWWYFKARCIFLHLTLPGSISASQCLNLRSNYFYWWPSGKSNTFLTSTIMCLYNTVHVGSGERSPDPMVSQDYSQWTRQLQIIWQRNRMFDICKHYVEMTSFIRVCIKIQVGHLLIVFSLNVSPE